jgi:hypothetical protein
LIYSLSPKGSGLRLFYPLIPIFIIFSVLGLQKAISHTKFKNWLKVTIISILLVTIALTTLPLSSPFSPLLFLTSSSDTLEDQIPKWASWAAENLDGKISIVDGGDLIMMNLADTRIGGVGMFDLYAPQSNISIIRTGYYSSLDESMDFFYNNNVKYLIVDSEQTNRRPYLSDVSASNSFTLVRSFDELDIYRIEYK